MTLPPTDRPFSQDTATFASIGTSAVSSYHFFHFSPPFFPRSFPINPFRISHIRTLLPARGRRAKATGVGGTLYPEPAAGRRRAYPRRSHSRIALGSCVPHTCTSQPPSLQRDTSLFAQHPRVGEGFSVVLSCLGDKLRALLQSRFQQLI